MAQTHAHTGFYQTIPPTASRGLLFLAAFLRAVDSSPGPALQALLAPTAAFIVNGGEATPAATIVRMLEMRAQRLKTFRHELKAAWDVDLGRDGAGKRVLMYESVSVTVFKADAEERCVEVAEFNTVELEPVAEGEGGGVEGLRATVLKMFMDANPIMMRLKHIGGPV